MTIVEALYYSAWHFHFENIVVPSLDAGMQTIYMNRTSDISDLVNGNSTCLLCPFSQILLRQHMRVYNKRDLLALHPRPFSCSQTDLP